MTTMVQKFARLAKTTTLADLPAEAVSESCRILLDSIGVAVAGIHELKGKAGIDYGRLTGGPVGAGDATIMGTGDRVSVFGAAFANGELISTLDFDSVLLPGHVSPYVLPGSMATAEAGRGSGKALIAATAVSHEMSYRFGKAMSGNRDVKDGKPSTAPVLGYAATVFGATAAVAKLRGIPTAAMANAIGIAAATTPVNAHRAWLEHAPPTTIKYLMAGALTNAAISAAFMAEMGHRGDLQILDDAEYGYPRFSGTTRWVPGDLTGGLGTDWLFPDHQNYKLYPACRVPHAGLDAVTEIVTREKLKPAEIDRIVSYGEHWAFFPSFLNQELGHIQDSQFSFAHILSMGAHLVPADKSWQDPAIVNSDSVLRLMGQVELKPHPDWGAAVAKDLRARPTRIEVHARGEVFVAERNYPSGSPSPEPGTRATDEQLIDKFRRNARGVLTPEATEQVIAQVTALEEVEDFSSVMALLRTRG